MISIAAAQKLVLQHTSHVGSERTDLGAAVGRILSDNIVSDSDLPPFNRSQMDGYAVRAADTIGAPVALKIVAESAAGRGWHRELKRGEAVRIMTGACVPDGADSVQRVELTREVGDEVEIRTPVRMGESVVKRGAEIRKGRTVIKAGAVINENMTAVLASFGYAQVKVGRQPRIGILATGSEIVDITKRPGRDQIRNSNSPMLSALCEKYGSVATAFPIAGDDLGALRSQIKRAAKGNDILIITGGVSVGKYDLTKGALRSLGAEVLFERVKLKPGKPTVFASLGQTLVFGLPGNPVSAAVTFYLFVRMSMLAMQGAASVQLRSGTAVLASDAKAGKDRDTYAPATLKTDKTGRLIATPLKTQGSSDFVGFSRADALVFIKAGTRYKMGGVVKISYL